MSGFSARNKHGESMGLCRGRPISQTKAPSQTKTDYPFPLSPSLVQAHTNYDDSLHKGMRATLQGGVHPRLSVKGFPWVPSRKHHLPSITPPRPQLLDAPPRNRLSPFHECKRIRWRTAIRMAESFPVVAGHGHATIASASDRRIEIQVLTCWLCWRSMWDVSISTLAVIGRYLW
jgi:hypothetical protein